jgi:hypothetical protein
VPSIEDSLCLTIKKILGFVKGSTPVVFFDAKQNKYFNASDCHVTVTDKLLRDLRGILGDANVIVK